MHRARFTALLYLMALLLLLLLWLSDPALWLFHSSSIPLLLRFGTILITTLIAAGHLSPRFVPALSHHLQLHHSQFTQISPLIRPSSSNKLIPSRTLCAMCVRCVCESRWASFSIKQEGHNKRDTLCALGNNKITGTVFKVNTSDVQEHVSLSLSVS